MISDFSSLLQQSLQHDLQHGLGLSKQKEVQNHAERSSKLGESIWNQTKKVK